MEEDHPVTPAQQYLLLEALMLRGRALGTVAEAQLDSLLEEMDQLWDQMSNDERQEADRHAAAMAAISAPDELHLQDVATRVGYLLMPRVVY
jgi:hypothetical protein